MSALPPPAEKRAAVQSMFDRVAPRYDLVNRLMTGGLDQRWRRRALREASVGPGDRMLDLACGTGDLCEQAAALGASVIGVDFSQEMLRGARRRRIDAAFTRADAESLPLSANSIDVVACGFALRNFDSLERAFAEIGRVLRPGGRIALLDVDRPRARSIAAAHSFYFDRVVPRVGGFLSDRQAYRYLPESTVYLPDANELCAMLERVGFEAIAQRRFLFGSAQLWLGRKAEA